MLLGGCRLADCLPVLIFIFPLLKQYFFSAKRSKTARSEQAAWRKWGGEAHRTCKYRFTPHLRQAAPDHSLFLFYFFFFPCGEAAKIPPPLFYCRKAAIFFKRKPRTTAGLSKFV